MLRQGGKDCLQVFMVLFYQGAVDNDIVQVYQGIVATEFPDLPANISYNTQGTLNELPLDVSNNMNQSDGNIEFKALSPNWELYQFDLLIHAQVIPQL
ncbi:hypothetical protein DSO57_1029168 [Entomophthora muscae]|uniref:Uncharacterized protein n=1 Tax=Entomophthora muscae TaxID=34485 RepID=A0ACC2S3C3_9FUNG|nr:hypothetical protein DSO57_1029168 [Entomophthora muscae]